MQMINYSQWMKETRRGLFTTRSVLLKNIDAAFKNLDRCSTPKDEIIAKKQLIDALALWLNSKNGMWEESTRNSKGTIKKLIQDLSKTKYGKDKLSIYLPQMAIQQRRSKTIVFSGHGSWESRKDGYVNLPAKCYMEFYTLNMKTLSDGLGGDIDRGLVSGLTPDQKNGPFNSIPNNRLYPPTGLHIKAPDPTTWDVVKLPNPIPINNKNLQIQIDAQYADGADLATIFTYLEPAIRNSSEVTFLWAACRAIGLKSRPGNIKVLGVNEMQR